MSHNNISDTEETVKENCISVTRYDLCRFDGKPKKTTQGFLRVNSKLSRVGVFVYKNSKGTVRRELRLPEEVFSPSAIESLKSAPVTFGHPSEGTEWVMVDSKNSKKFTVGMLGEDIRNDEKYLEGTLLITDASAIEAVETGKRREISLGYECDLEYTPGVWDGQPYDAIQRNIVNNHAAIVPYGRAGSEVRIRMDSDDAITEYELETTQEVTMTESKLIHVDGVDFEVSMSAAQAIEKTLDSHSKQLTAIQAELDSTKGQLDATKSALEIAVKARQDAEDPELLNKSLVERLDIITKAQKVLGTEEDLLSLSNRQIKEKAISKTKPEMKFDGLSDDYIMGHFDLMLELQAKKQESLESVQKAIDSTKNVVSTASRQTHINYLNKKGGR